MIRHRSPGLRDSTGEGNIFPSSDYDVLWSEGITAHHRLPDVPLGSLPDLYARLVSSGVEIPLQFEVNSRLLLSELFHLVTVELSYLTAGVEGCDEGGILLSRPVLVGEFQRILRELLGTVGEGEVAVKTQPGVVEPETHEGEEEVYLLVDLRNRVPDIFLVVSIVIPAATLSERIKFVFPDLVQPARVQPRLLVERIRGWRLFIRGPCDKVKYLSLSVLQALSYLPVVGAAAADVNSSCVHRQSEQNPR